jgi:hypothetical protein
MKNIAFPNVMPYYLVDVSVGMKMEAVHSTETSLNIWQIIQHFISRCHNVSKLAVLPLL